MALDVTTVGRMGRCHVCLGRSVFSVTIPDEDNELTRRDWLAQEFERHRGHLRAVGYRMLGSVSEADDAVRRPGCGLTAATRVAAMTFGAG